MERKNNILSDHETSEIQSALSDILGKKRIKDVSIEFEEEKELTSGDGTWDGNVYKYNFKAIKDIENP